MNLQLIDFRFDWEHSKVIICFKNLATCKHFYIHQHIDSEQEADEIISAWEIATTMFYDTEYQHPN